MEMSGLALVALAIIAHAFIARMQLPEPIVSVLAFVVTLTAFILALLTVAKRAGL